MGQACVLGVLTCAVSRTWAPSAPYPSARGPCPRILSRGQPHARSVPGEGVAVHSCCVNGTGQEHVCAAAL